MLGSGGIGGGGGFSGPMGGVRGLQTAGLYAASLDNLTDDNIVGKVYDNRVVTRLLTYVKSFKKQAFVTICARPPLHLGQRVHSLFGKGGHRGRQRKRRPADSHCGHHLPGRSVGPLWLQLPPDGLHAQGRPGSAISAAHPDVQPSPVPVPRLLPPHRGGTHHVSQPERRAAAPGDLRPHGRELRRLAESLRYHSRHAVHRLAVGLGLPEHSARAVAAVWSTGRSSLAIPSCASGGPSPW